MYVGNDQDYECYFGSLQLYPEGFILECRYKQEVFEGLSLGEDEHRCLLVIKGTYKTEDADDYPHIWAKSVKLTH